MRCLSCRTNVPRRASVYFLFNWDQLLKWGPNYWSLPVLKRGKRAPIVELRSRFWGGSAFRDFGDWSGNGDDSEKWRLGFAMKVWERRLLYIFWEGYISHYLIFVFLRRLIQYRWQIYNLCKFRVAIWRFWSLGWHSLNFKVLEWHSHNFSYNICIIYV